MGLDAQIDLHTSPSKRARVIRAGQEPSSAPPAASTYVPVPGRELVFVDEVADPSGREPNSAELMAAMSASFASVVASMRAPPVLGVNGVRGANRCSIAPIAAVGDRWRGNAQHRALPPVSARATIAGDRPPGLERRSGG